MNHPLIIPIPIYYLLHNRYDWPKEDFLLLFEVQDNNEFEKINI